jgi:putative sigma-54 modulation protein
MQTNLSCRHFHMTPPMAEYAAKRVEKLSRYFDRIEQINVVINKEHHEYTTEINVDVEHHDPIIARSHDPDLYAAIDSATDKAVRQLSDLKSRLRDSKHHTSTGGREP